MHAYARWLFGIAAAFNLSMAGGLLFLRPWIAPILKLDPPSGTNLAAVNITGVLIATFGYAYARVAMDPARFRPYVTLGIVGKLLVVAATLFTFLAGSIDWRLPALAGFDCVFTVLFLDYLRRTR